MKQWYLYYTTEASKLQRPIAEIVLMAGIEVKSAKLQRPVAELKGEKLQRPVGELMKQPVSENWNDASNDFPTPFALFHGGSTLRLLHGVKALKKHCFICSM